MNVNVKKALKIFFPAAAMLAVMAVIFILSSQTGEKSAQTSAAVEDIVQSLPGNTSSGGGSAQDGNSFIGSFDIRKSAHIILYFMLGATAFLFATALISQIFRTAGPALAATASGGALVICFLYALSDEWHQMFMDGRGASMYDVGVDAIGFCTAVVLCFAAFCAIYFIKSRIKRVN